MEKKKLSKPKPKTKTKSEKVKSFLAVRDYIGVMLDKKTGEIETDIANTLKTVDQKKLQNYYAGKSSLTYENSKQIVDLFVGNGFYTYIDSSKNVKTCKKYDASKHDKAGVLRKLLSYFLKLHKVKNPDTDTDDDIESFLNKYFLEQAETNSDELKPTKKRETIQADIEERLKKAMSSNKFVYFTGKSGSGKKRVTEIVMNDFMENKGFKYKYCLDFEKNEMSYTSFLKIILSESESLSDSINMPTTKMERKAGQYLSDKKCIMFINGFDHIKTEADRTNLIIFLKFYLTEGSVVVITGNEPKERYDYLDDAFAEVNDRKYTYPEWELFSASFDNLPMIRKAKEFYPGLNKLAYTKGCQIPSLMRDYLFDFAKQIMLEDSYTFDIESNKYIFGKILSDLDDDCLYVLAALSMFSKEISNDQLVKISGLYEADKLSEALDTLRRKKLIKKRTLQNKLQLYSLPNKLRASIEEEKNRNPQKYEHIYDNWVNYYLAFTKRYDISTDDEKYESENENIRHVLNYCEENRFDDYRKILEQIW